MPRLEMRRVVVRFDALTVLRGLDLSVQAGECVTVSGELGAGRSTLLRLACGALRPAGGDVRVDGRPLAASVDANARAGVLLVRAQDGYFPSLTVSENLALASADGRAGFDDRLPILEQRARQVAGTLSGGERQLLALLGALQRGPRLLLLDEPLLGLSEGAGEQIVGLIGEAMTAGSAVVITEDRPSALLEPLQPRRHELAGGRLRDASSAEPRSRQIERRPRHHSTEVSNQLVRLPLTQHCRRQLQEAAGERNQTVGEWISALIERELGGREVAGGAR